MGLAEGVRTPPQQRENPQWGLPSSPPVPALSGSNRFAGWALLAALQAAVSLVLFHDYVFGDKFFAFADIGSDSFSLFVPALIHMATPENWSGAWSFNVGLGAVMPLTSAPLSPFTLLGIAAGPEHVLDMRIWVYLAKIFAGGAAFYGFVLATGARREIALVVALAYSFCGFVATDGQWDPFSTEFVAYALMLWAIARHATHRNTWLIPLTVACAAYSGAFIFSVGIFVAYTFAAAALASDRPRATTVIWLRSILPQCAVGLLLSAPIVLPLVFQVLDSPRVTGAQSGFSDRLSELLAPNDPYTILIQFAGMFHKNMLGVGDLHKGWMNYLESPVFFVGALPLLLIPQLWRGSRTDRRILAAGGLALGLFIALPAIRYLAFGFGLDYFRVNNLWISILLLAMFARALGCVSERGIDRSLFGGTAVTVLAIWPMLLAGELHPWVSMPHAMKIFAFLAVALLLGLALGRVLQWRQFALLALGFVAAEAAVINYPSFHAQRKVVTRQTPGYNDKTVDALAYLKALDPGFYRIEKTYHSVSLNDALAQGYMGVKSYWFQGAGTVGFYTDLELLPRRSPKINFTNWLPSFGDRFVLNSLVGVKYMITKSALDWPGFRRIYEAGGLSILENDMALPLGVVYEEQFLRERFATLSVGQKDFAMMNAVIVDSLRGDTPRVFDVRRLTRESADLDRPGFLRIYETGVLSIFERNLALPLGVAYGQEFLRERPATPPVGAKDIAMTNAVIANSARGDAPRVFGVRELTRESAGWLRDNYFTPVRLLQRRGMVVERFSQGSITGKIASDVPGVLVFSIPYAKGWSVAIDAVEQPVFRANLGMLATDISRGEHRIELRYSLPGFIPGLLIGLLGLLGIWVIGALERRAPPTSP